MLHEKYKLSVVSGGTPLLPGIDNRSLTSRNASLLTPDNQSYIVPFNNQVKIYSLETRQCVKMIKYSNNSTLQEVFTSDAQTNVVHISLGDIFASSDSQNAENRLTLISNRGDLLVLNYKGKLVEEVPHSRLELGEETIVKVMDLDDPSEKVVITTLEDETAYTYKFYLYQKGTLKFIKSHGGVLLSTWSKNGKYVALLVKGEHMKRSVILESLMDDSRKETFAVPAHHTAKSSVSKFITSMALDNAGETLALGYASGVISVVNVNTLAVKLLKWHIDAVLSMSFSYDDTYLLSGGWEKVLCFWHMSTNLQQFLPRMNGVIIDCNIINEQYFALTTQMAENLSSTDTSVLLINSTDLLTRLSITGPFSVFQSCLKDAIHPLSATNTKTSTSAPKVHASRKKDTRKLVKAKRQDFTTYFEIHPLTKHLYFPHRSAVQVYDFYKNDQVSYQYISSGINNAMGKVRSELNLQDPEVLLIKFSRDGSWMVTYEVETLPEGLLSSKDVTHVLKFWALDSQKEWQLETKVMHPHGTNVPITAILMAPAVINNTHGCITADNNGGLKYWSLNKDGNWCLSKVLEPKFNHFSSNVSLAWSHDGSLVFHAFDDKLSVIDFFNFCVFTTGLSNGLDFASFDSAIQCIELLNHQILAIATKTTLKFLNILTGKVMGNYDVYPYVDGIYKTNNMSRLMCCDQKNSRLAFVINERQEDPALTVPSYKSRILLFSAEKPSTFDMFEHDEYISCIAWNSDTDFIFMDINHRLGVLSATASSEMLLEIMGMDAVPSPNQFQQELKELSLQHKANLASAQDEEKNLELIQGENTRKVVNLNSFTSLFENIDNIQMDTLFDRVMKVIS